MRQTAETMRVYLDETQHGCVTCPSCQTERVLTVKNYKEYIGGKALKVKCKACETIFPVLFDYRRHPRVPVNFNGKLLKGNKFFSDKNILVTSLSASGVGFVLNDTYGLKHEDTIEITFTLDDRYQSTIQEKVVIRRIIGQYIGAEYAHDDYRHELDFYIMSKPALL